MPNTIVELRGIHKRFGGIHALNNVSLTLQEGETLSLVGENGSGKSTLMKILSGVYTKDEGEIFINGQKANIHFPSDAKNYGIGIVHQEISLVDEMTIAQNIFLGSEISRNGFLRNGEMEKAAQHTLDEFNLNLSVKDKVASLSVAQKQLVEIAKATFFNCKVLILDEPTATLTDEEVEVLFAQIKRLKEKNVSIIFISHRLNEVLRISNRVAVLRDGVMIGDALTKDLDNDKIVYMMVGRELKGLDYVAPEGKDVLLEGKHLVNQYLKDVSFTLRKGEILGVAGLVGSRRTELARAIFGIDKIDSGEFFYKGKKINFKSPADAIQNGFALVPEDRKGNGLILADTIRFNTTILVLKDFISGIVVNKRKENEIADKYANSLHLKYSSLNQKCSELSGGNQQKVVVGKWLAKNSDIIIFDEPTRGIDVGAKEEIYQLIRRLVDEDGLSVILISSEMREIVDLSSRVIVMHEGKLIKEINDIDHSPEGRKELQKKIGFYMIGGNDNGKE